MRHVLYSWLLFMMSLRHWLTEQRDESAVQIIINSLLPAVAAQLINNTVHESVLFPIPTPLSGPGSTETGGAFSYKQARADSSGVPSAGCLGDGPLPSREQGHATLPQTGAAGLALCSPVARRQIPFHRALRWKFKHMKIHGKVIDFHGSGSTLKAGESVNA